MAKISFLIPVYNVEEYLPECVNSILHQGQTDIEVLLIDDGSTDGSGALCDGFAAQNDCVRAIHQKNTGAAAARNNGLDHAEGEFIAFLDSDDRIAPGSIRHLLAWIDNGGADMCFLEAIRFFPDGRRVPLGDNILREEVRGKCPESVCRHLAARPKFAGSACTKIYRSAFLRENRLRFPTDRRHGEDLSFCRDCILRAKSFDKLDMPYYEYRQGRRGSATATVSENSFWDILRFVSETADRLTTDKKAGDPASGYMMSAAAYEYSLLIWQYSYLPRETKARAMKEMKQYAWVLDFAGHRLVKLVAVASRVAGFRMTSRMLACYKRSARG